MTTLAGADRGAFGFAASRFCATRSMPLSSMTSKHAMGVSAGPCGETGFEIETGVMPGAAHSLTDHQPFGERPAIVSADGAGRE